MFEFDMHDIEFLAPGAHDGERRAQPVWSPTLEMLAELGLVTVAESEAARRLSRR